MRSGAGVLHTTFSYPPVSSNINHVNLARAERAGFDSAGAARNALRDLKKSIERDGFPAGTISDTRPNRVLVPFGKDGYAVYQITPRGNAVFRTILEART